MGLFIFTCYVVALVALTLADKKEKGRYGGLAMIFVWGTIAVAWVLGIEYLLVLVVAGIVTALIRNGLSVNFISMDTEEGYEMDAD